MTKKFSAVAALGQVEKIVDSVDNVDYFNALK